MGNQPIKKLNPAKNDVQTTHHYDLSVMKPFVKFGIKALGVLGHTLIGIVKSVPKPADERLNKDDRIIKI